MIKAAADGGWMADHAAASLNEVETIQKIGNTAKVSTAARPIA